MMRKAVSDRALPLQTVTFDVGIVADKSAIKTSKGVANEEEESASQPGRLPADLCAARDRPAGGCDLH